MFNKVFHIPMLLAWTLLVLFILASDMFLYLYQYLIAFTVLAGFIFQLHCYIKEDLSTQSPFSLIINTWRYIWRTVLTLFLTTVLIMLLAMIFYPDDFIYYRVMSVILILVTNIFSIYLFYGMQNIKNIPILKNFYW
ncbi:hypothetical protein [Pseudoalteromonas denitrificans]|uniref:Uncharacterized protein n=1 Tax=Pseudoalteromonas denitrificans DSM 6059 TaxID=1123010 RepID=A0A1I1K0L5_9GAMM|nr:hypothetical protein [Pseudoalteromonas denitrificans]SFC54286.1 hypothetical protein SAMN02745724_01933 [Pseudoalteromonas denitrificans DSM 6059]